MESINPYESPQLNPLLEIESSNASQPDRERFGVIPFAMFLMGLAVVTGVYSSRDTVWWPLTASTFYSWRVTAISAVSIAAILLYAIRWWTGGKTFPQHFGHWFLVCDGVAWFANQPLEALDRENYIRAQDGSNHWVLDSNPSDLLLFLRSLFHLINLSTLAIAAWHCRNDRHWHRYCSIRIAYAFWCVLHGLFFATGNPQVLTLLFVGLIIGQLVSFAIAILSDVAHYKRRDYLHWMGIGVEGHIYLIMNIVYAWTLLRFTVHF